MNTLEESSAYPEGVVDVSIIVPVCFENPLKEDSITFVSEVLARKRRAALPTTAVIGACHIATPYLRVPRIAVKQVLTGILKMKSKALFPYIAPEIVSNALDYAATYNIESWDGYLVALARSLGSSIVFSLDEDLRRVKEIAVVNPFPQEKVRQYHEFIASLLGSGSARSLEAMRA